MLTSVISVAKGDQYKLIISQTSEKQL